VQAVHGQGLEAPPPSPRQADLDVHRPSVGAETEVRAQVAALLHREVAAMNLDNFVVRPHRRTVEQYARREAWTRLPPKARVELAQTLAGLPAELDGEAEEANRFDLLVLNLQLALLRSEPGFARLRDQVKQLAGLLEEKAAIPMVRA
jgi:type I restriction enzyme R subunit